MVEGKAPNNLILKPSSILETKKAPSQNHETSSKEPELARKMIPQKQPPNYMKATSCSKARNKNKQVPEVSSNRSSRRTKSVSKSSRATCSSTLKDGKFPPFLELSQGGSEFEGASVVKVCRYRHCSLNGHGQSPPLKTFLSARRKALREERLVMKLVTVSPCQKGSCEDGGEMKEEVGVDLVDDSLNNEGVNNLLFDEEKNDFFFVYVKEGEDEGKGVLEEKESTLVDMDFGKKCFEEEDEDGMTHGGDGSGIFKWENATSDQESDAEFTRLDIGDGIFSPSDQESESTFVHPSGDETLSLLDKKDLKREGADIAFLKDFTEEEQDESSRDEITDCFVQFCDYESSANDLYEEKELYQFLQDDGFSDDDKAAHEEHPPISREILKEAIPSDEEHESTASSPVSQETGNLNINHDESNICERLKTRIRSRKQWESSESLKQFKTREPNYLEAEPSIEGEKVELKHSETGERRNAEEWMIDYALRKAVNQLAIERKRKVALLVEAFEKVVPPGSQAPL